MSWLRILHSLVSSAAFTGSSWAPNRTDQCHTRNSFLTQFQTMHTILIRHDVLETKVNNVGDKDWILRADFPFGRAAPSLVLLERLLSSNQIAMCCWNSRILFLCFSALQHNQSCSWMLFLFGFVLLFCKAVTLLGLFMAVMEWLQVSL